MEASKRADRERRRTKLKKANWARLLISPQTLEFLVAVGKVITLVVKLYYLLTNSFQE